MQQNRKLNCQLAKKAFATSLIEGRVSAIFVKPGQVVKAKAKLAEVESKKLRNMQLELLQAASTMRWTAREVARLRPLAIKKVTSTQEYLKREQELKTLKQKIGSLNRRLTLIGLSDEAIKLLGAGKLRTDDGSSLISGQITIRAPIAGRVADIGSSLGQLVHAHDSLFEIQDASKVWIKALVLETDASRIRLRQNVVTTFASNPNLRIRGTIVRLAPQLVSRERVLPLWIEIPNPQEFLKDGMLARVTISVPKKSVPKKTVPVKQ